MPLSERQPAVALLLLIRFNSVCLHGAIQYCRNQHHYTLTRLLIDQSLSDKYLHPCQTWNHLRWNVPSGSLTLAKLSPATRPRPNPLLREDVLACVCGICSNAAELSLGRSGCGRSALKFISPGVLLWERICLEVSCWSLSGLTFPAAGSVASRFPEPKTWSPWLIAPSWICSHSNLSHCFVTLRKCSSIRLALLQGTCQLCYVLGEHGKAALQRANRAPQRLHG